MSHEHKPHSTQELVERIRLDLEFSPSDDGYKALTELVEQYEGALATIEILQDKEALSDIIASQTEELDGLKEQINTLHNQLGGESMRCEKAEGDLKRTLEQLEAAQKRLAWYEGLQGEANDADFASMQSDVEYHELKEQVEAARQEYRGAASARANLARENKGLLEQLESARTALELVGAIQRTRLGWYRDQGVVFKSKLNGDPDPDDWESIAFWTYTDLCEVESIARATLEESNPASEPKT